MMYGTKPCKTDPRDFDLHKTFGAISVPDFPKEFNVDIGVWMPDQNSYEPIFDNQPQPFGCTNYTSSDICANQDGLLYNPAYLEMYSHANANGGYDVRESLLLTIKQGTQTKDKKINFRTAVFNVKPHAPLDAFDSIRYAMLSGGTEKRCVSWGTPWYTEWEVAAKRWSPIMPAPATYDPKGLGWHNSLFVGWKTINGVPYLVNKSWQGTGVGDKGFLYFGREVVNATMSVSGSCAFTVTAMGADNSVKTIDVSFWEKIRFFLTRFLNLSY